MLNIIKFIVSLFHKKTAEKETVLQTPVEELEKEVELELEPEIVPSSDLEKISHMYPGIRSVYTNFLRAVLNAGYSGGFHMVYRTYAEQDKLYAQGRTKPGNIVTNVKGGYSYHNYGLAADFVFKNSKGNWSWDNSFPWNAIGKIGESFGLEWGGSWKTFPDRPHFQITFKPKGMTDTAWLENLRSVFLKRKKIEDVWSFIEEKQKKS